MIVHSRESASQRTIFPQSKIISLHFLPQTRVGPYHNHLRSSGTNSGSMGIVKSYILTLKHTIFSLPLPLFPQMYLSAILMFIAVGGNPSVITLSRTLHPTFLISISFVGTNDGKEHVEGDLNSVDENQPVLGADELKVESMDTGPYLLRTLARCEQVALDLIPNDGEGVTVHKPKVREENSHEQGAPQDLIDGDLGENSGRSGSLHL